MIFFFLQLRDDWEKNNKALSGKIPTRKVESIKMIKH